MFNKFAIAAIAAVASAQQIGYNTQEQHLSISMQECHNGPCENGNASVVLDGNWRWLHNVGGYSNCYTGSSWDMNYCPDDKTCAE